MNSKIIGTGSYLPNKILSNDDLSQMVETSDEWIFPRTGMKERRIAEGEKIWEMASKAGKNALEMAGISANEIDVIICATVTPDYFFPSTACIVQRELKAKNAICFDVSAACSGFIYCLELADNYIKTGKAKNVLCISSEALSRIVDYEDRGTCVLFGDGSGAAVVSRSEDNESGILGIKLLSDGSDAEKLSCRATSSQTIFVDREKGKDRRIDKNYLYMEGQSVFKFAVSTVPVLCKALLDESNINVEDLSQLVLHQANIRIINGVIKKLGIAEEKCFINIQKYGNTSSASVIVAFDEAVRSGAIKKGDYVELCAFGAGFTAGATLIKW